MNKILISLLLCILIIPLVSSLSVNIPGLTSITINVDTGTGTSSNHSNSTDFWITAEGDLGDVSDILGSDITNDLGWITSAGADSWSGNYTFYYNKTQLTNGTWVMNNTSPTFINMTSTYGILNFIYDYVGLLTIDVNSRLLYDLATKLSIDFNDRKLYASDGTDIILDWNKVGTADFGNSNITTTGNVSASYYCNSTNCYTVNDFLIDTTGAGTDSWAGNYTLYYNKTLIDKNFTFYYLKTEVDNNLTLYYLKTEIDNNFSLYLPLTGGTLSGNLTLPSINITTNYVCNSTNCYTINDFLIDEGSSYNVTYANYVIANISNMSYYWNNLASSSDIVIGDLTPSNLDLTGYALAVTYINGSFGVLNMKAEDWVLEGVDLVINQDLYIGGTLYPNATLSRDIGSGALRWNILWVSNISSENIDNSGKITSGTYCNSTGTCRDLSAWGQGVDLSLYYLKTEVDNNFTLYTPITSLYANLTNYILSNGSRAMTGDLNLGGFNITNIGNLTANYICNSSTCYVLNDFLSTAGDGSFNQTYHDYVVANISNQTYNWITSNNLTVNGINITWLDNVAGFLSFKLTQLETWFTGKLTDINNNINLNLTASKEYSNTILSGNLTDYYNKSQVDYNMSLISSSDSWAGNYTFYYNKTLIDNNFTLYFLISSWSSNLTNIFAQINNNYTSALTTENSNINSNYTSSLTTCNANINNNLTQINTNLYSNLSNYILANGSRSMTGDLNFSDSNITNPSYIIMKETDGACDLTINHSWCSNSTGSYFVG